MYLCPLPYSCRQSLSNLDRVSMAISIYIQTLSIILAVQSTSCSLTPSHRRYARPAMATSVSPNTTYMDVMSQQLHHLIPTVSIRLVLIMLQLLRTAFLLVQATVCCRLYNRIQAAEVVWTTKKMWCKRHTLVWLIEQLSKYKIVMEGAWLYFIHVIWSEIWLELHTFW